jgi:hypothetical protein
MKKSIFPPRNSDPVYATLNDWILHESIPFSIDSPESFNAAIDRGIASLYDSENWTCLREHCTLPQVRFFRSSYSPNLPRTCSKPVFISPDIFTG